MHPAPAKAHSRGEARVPAGVGRSGWRRPRSPPPRNDEPGPETGRSDAYPDRTLGSTNLFELLDLGSGALIDRELERTSGRTSLGTSRRLDSSWRCGRAAEGAGLENR